VVDTSTSEATNEEEVKTFCKVISSLLLMGIEIQLEREENVDNLLFSCGGLIWAIEIFMALTGTNVYESKRAST